jgi:aminoglycoside phosphotransferase (APT) family kinase protein
LDNLMFGTDDVVALDWQTFAVGPPTRDVAYFLGTCLEPTDRRHIEEDLVAGYHTELVERGVTGYSLDQCFDDYRLAQLHGVMITGLGAAYSTRERSAEADGMFLAMARRCTAAVRDLRSLDAL